LAVEAEFEDEAVVEVATRFFRGVGQDESKPGHLLPCVL
jgi:hypothetical protein